MKRLSIRYGDHQLVDCDIAQFAFSEDEAAGLITVTANLPRPAKSSSAVSGVADLLGALAGAKKNQTANDVVRRRRELDAEKAELITEAGTFDD